MKKNKVLIITEKDFSKKIKNRDGNFRNLIFNFEVDFSNKNIDFSLDFTNSIFEKKVNLNESIFYEKIYFVNNYFKDFFESKNSIFKKNIDLSNSIFKETFSLYKSIFKNDFFLEDSDFKKAAIFEHCRFMGNAFFLKVHFHYAANFSYVFFYKDKQVSFVSINKEYEFDKKKIDAPFLIFRAVDFYENVEFRDIDLSRSVFQDSTFEDGVYFKECEFTQNKGRDCFYEEIAKKENFHIPEKYFNNFLRQKIIFLFLPNNLKNNKLKKLNITDRIIFKNDKISKKLWKEYFILAKDTVTDIELKKRYLKNKYKKYNFNKTIELLSDIEENSNKNIFIEKTKKTEKIKKYYIFKLKQFDELKSWENIEFLSRQMKRNLANSTNWQKSGDFYIGEMRAKNKKLKLRNEDVFYRYFLHFYDIVSAFGERIWKVVLTMFISFVSFYFILAYFRPDLTFYQIIVYISRLFVPVLGDKDFLLLDIQWGERAKIFFIFASLWFYILWFLLILSIQRKFKK